MTTDLRRAPGTPCWTSLMAHRADQARDFYAALFGWEFTPGPEQLGAYVLAEKDGRKVAGIGEGSADPHRPVSWTTMLAADDVDLAAETVRECGGTVGIGPLNAGEDGRVAIAVDPSGAVFGIWQAGTFAGAEAAGEPGSVAWSELVTYDADLTGKFYEAVFGLEVATSEADAAGGADAALRDEEAPGEGRVLLRAGGRPVAGVRGAGRDLPRDRGAHWTTAFAVPDAPAAADLAVRLGGRLLAAPATGPHGVTATVADPEGAPFTLLAR